LRPVVFLPTINAFAFLQEIVVTSFGSERALRA